MTPEKFELLPNEEITPSIYSPLNTPKLKNIGDLAHHVHLELTEMHEVWSGLKLAPTSAYGMRFYRNLSSLVMHYDIVSDGAHRFPDE